MLLLSKNNINNLILIGGMKCGTTSLRELLRVNGVFFGVKEEHYFDDVKKIEKYGTYKKYLSTKYGDNLHDYQYVGDDTPTYSYKLGLAEAIYQDCPSAKLIFVVRDPLTRAVSNYWHAVRRGVESRDINTAFLDELEKENSNPWLNYLERSSFSIQYRNFEDYFPAENIHVVSLEGLLDNFSNELVLLSEFLDMPISGGRLPKINVANFFGRPKINIYFGAWTNKFFATKVFGVLLRKAFSYSLDQVPKLDPTVTNACKELLSIEYDFVLKTYKKEFG